jgi:hypothetical protein
MVVAALCNAGLFLGLGLVPVSAIAHQTALQFERCAEALGPAAP